MHPQFQGSKHNGRRLRFAERARSRPAPPAPFDLNDRLRQHFADTARLRELAATIRDAAHLEEILSTLKDPEMRAAVRAKILPLCLFPRKETPVLEVQIAQVCHEVNRAYCQALGDDSQPAWADAPGWQKESAIAGVTAILEHPETTPEQSHENWLREKHATGWVYGPVKDADAKTHPCVRSYAELPVEQRAKDHIFGAVVRAMAALFESAPSH